MILSELNKILLNIARSNYLVNDAFVGDVYTINAKENKFGCFVATPMSAVKEEGIIRFTYVLYYIDRLTKDEANIDSVQSDAVSMLKGAIDFLGQNGVEVEDGFEFTLFRQKFSDWCAGSYVNVHFSVPDNDCIDGEFNLSGDELMTLTVNKNGIYTPGPGYDGYNRITVNVPQVGATEEWVDDEIDTKLTGYATEDWVNAQGFLTQHQDLSDYATKDYVDDEIADLRQEFPTLDAYATKNWVNNQGFLKECDLDGLASETYVNSQGFLKSADLSGLATETYVNSQGFIKVADLDGYATEDFVERQGFLVPSDLDDYATKAWVNNQDFLTEGAIDGLASETWVRNQGYLVGSDLNDYATRAWTISQGYITESALCDYATQDWVIAQDYLVEDDLCGYATESYVRNWVTAQEYLRQCDLDGYATENWVERQGYVKEHEISQIYATKTWVNEQIESQITTSLEGYATIDYVENNYVSNTTIDGYATEEWVSENFISDVILDDYATKVWVESNYFEENKIWYGTQSQWNQLSSAQKASYTIALITQ